MAGKGALLLLRPVDNAAALRATHRLCTPQGGLAPGEHGAPEMRAAGQLGGTGLPLCRAGGPGRLGSERIVRGSERPLCS